jgi:hypothetical protein
METAPNGTGVHPSDDKGVNLEQRFLVLLGENRTAWRKLSPFHPGHHKPAVTALRGRADLRGEKPTTYRRVDMARPQYTVTADTVASVV